VSTKIESPSNPRIKELVKLRESSRRRRERGVFFVEGGNELLALARAGRKVIELYSCSHLHLKQSVLEQLDELQKIGVPVIETSQIAQEKASYRSTPQELIGIVEAWDLSLNSNTFVGNAPLVILDEVEKPGNLGAILRSVEAFGGAGVLLSDPTLDFFNPNVVRSSRGLMGAIPLAIGSKQEVLNWLIQSDREIVATSSRAEEELARHKLPNSAAFLFGSEKYGLGDYWQSHVVRWVRIPMKGTASSLNLNVSVACLLYENNRT